MDKYVKLFIVVAVLVVLSLAGLFIYLRRPKMTQKTADVERQQSQEFPENPEQGDLGYEEPDATVDIGTEGISKATFDRVEAGNIFVREGGEVVQYPLTTDEVVLACTDQEITTATDVNYDQIVRIKISTPDEIGSLIPTSEPVILDSDPVDGVDRVHTVAIASAKCPAE